VPATKFRLSYGGLGHGWYVVRQELVTDGRNGAHWRESVIAGPYTSKQAAAERAAAETILVTS